MRSYMRPGRRKEVGRKSMKCIWTRQTHLWIGHSKNRNKPGVSIQTLVPIQCPALAVIVTRIWGQWGGGLLPLAFVNLSTPASTPTIKSWHGVFMRKDSTPHLYLLCPSEWSACVLANHLLLQPFSSYHSLVSFWAHFWWVFFFFFPNCFAQQNGPSWEYRYLVLGRKWESSQEKKMTFGKWGHPQWSCSKVRLGNNAIRPLSVVFYNPQHVLTFFTDLVFTHISYQFKNHPICHVQEGW